MVNDMYQNSVYKEQYISLMDALKQENQTYINYIFNSMDFRIKQVINEIQNHRFLNVLWGVKKFCINRKNNKQVTNFSNVKSNYFTDKKIAIYTCIIGNYDSPREPLYIPNNCDFYYISDKNILKENTKWKYIDIKQIERTDGLTNAEKNRFVKIHPELIFPDYNYSIYIDGNIKIISDPTEFIQNIPMCGIATFMHPTNNCAYAELQNCIKLHKVDKKSAFKYTEYMKQNGMPMHYGLAYCGFLVREHNNKVCIKIMSEWWEEYLHYIKRDQTPFAYILFKNGIMVKDVAVLGNNIYKNFALRILPHFMKD